MLCANHRPILNDVTHAELQLLLYKASQISPTIANAISTGKLTCFSSGQASPCLDLARLNKVTIYFWIYAKTYSFYNQSLFIFSPRLWHYTHSQNSLISFGYLSWFLGENLHNFVSPNLKFHNLYCPSLDVLHLKKKSFFSLNFAFCTLWKEKIRPFQTRALTCRMYYFHE